jgi:hypothetical protein
MLQNCNGLLAIWHLESKTVLFWVIVFLPKFAVAGPSHLVWFKNLTSTILIPSQGTIPKFRWPARSELIQNHKEGDHGYVRLDSRQ